MNGSSGLAPSSAASDPPAPALVTKRWALIGLSVACVASGLVGGIVGVNVGRTVSPQEPTSSLAVPATGTEQGTEGSTECRPLRGYIASPLIFLPGAFEEGGIMDTIKEEFARHGIEVLTPLDNPANYDRDKIPPEKLGEAIAKGDYGLVDKADFVIADLTPWPPDPQGRHDRAPSADSGTTAEAAYAFGLGKPVFIFTNSDLPYFKRIQAMHGVDSLTPDANIPEIMRTPDGIMVDVTGGFDNLMLPAIGSLSGGTVHIIKVTDSEQFYTDLTGLDASLKDVRTHFEQKRGEAASDSRHHDWNHVCEQK